MRPTPAEALRLPALEAWRAELRAGIRTELKFDPLWKAACEELNAAESPPELRAGYIANARRIIRAAIGDTTK